MTVLVPPNAPNKPTLISASNSTIAIVWNIPEENGDCISKYEIEVGRNKFQEKIGSYFSSQTNFIIQKLDDDTLYDFRVAAVNSLGRSDFGEFSQFQTKKSSNIVKDNLKFLEIYFNGKHQQLGDAKKSRISNNGLTIDSIADGISNLKITTRLGT